MCNKELKIPQKKQNKRERVFTFLYEQNMDWMEEMKTNIYRVNKMGREESK